MSTFPLQDELIDAVIAFANLNLRDPNQISEVFRGTWQPTDRPTLGDCRRIQSETRKWLARAAGAEGIGTPRNVLAMIGLDEKGKPIDSTGLDERRRQLGVAPDTPMIPFRGGVRFVGNPGYKIHRDGRKIRHTITWHWAVSDAPLRAVCGLAVSSVYQAELHERVGKCARKKCGNFFIDRKSRGIRREYCGDPDCEKERNIERVKRSRGQQ